MSGAGPIPTSITLPPGTFRIDREGAWRHEGQEITHPGVLENLYANLRVEGDEHYLQVGPARISVTVDDAPFVVTRVECVRDAGAEGDRLRIHLGDGSREWLSPESLWIGPTGTPYCRVKSGRFRARLSLAAWLQLAPLVAEGSTLGDATLVLAGRRYPVRRTA